MFYIPHKGFIYLEVSFPDSVVLANIIYYDL